MTVPLRPETLERLKSPGYLAKICPIMAACDIAGQKKLPGVSASARDAAFALLGTDLTDEQWLTASLDITGRRSLLLRIQADGTEIHAIGVPSVGRPLLVIYSPLTGEIITTLPFEAQHRRTKLYDRRHKCRRGRRQRDPRRGRALLEAWGDE